MLFDKIDPPLSLNRQLDLTFKNLNLEYLIHIDRKDFSDFEGFQEAARNAEYKIMQIKNYKNTAQKDADIKKQNDKKNHKQKRNQ